MYPQTFVPKTKFEKEHYGRGLSDGEAKGKAEGKAEGILAFLAARGIAVDDEIRQQIRSCTDLALLDRWIVRSATATRAADVVSER